MLWAIAKLDLLRRVQRPGFLVFIGALLLTGYYLVPGPTAGYTTLSYHGLRGIYNSGYTGTTVAVLTSLLVSLVGFYLVAGAISNDRRGGIGYIIASTPMTRAAYVGGKLVGNCLYLLTFPLVLWVAAIAMQLWRGEEKVQLLVLAWPFLLLPVVTAAIVAGMAIFFENIRWLRGAGGLIVYFFLWATSLSLPVMMERETALYLDPNGIAIVMDSLARSLGHTGPLVDSNITLGIVGGNASGVFIWPGIAPSPSLLAIRLGWVVIGLGLGMVSIKLFDRFDPACQRSRPRGHSSTPTSPSTSPDTVHLSRSHSLPPHLFPGQAIPVSVLRQARSLWWAEIRLILTSHRWFLPACALMAFLAFVLPLQDARRIGLLLALFLPTGLLADLCRERQVNTLKLIATVPTAPQFYLIWKWGVGMTILLMTTVFGLTRFLLVGELSMSLALLGGIAFVAAWAVIIGAWTNSSKAFIASYLPFWFLTGSNVVPPWLDYVGIYYGGQDARVSLTYLGLAILAIAIPSWACLRH